MRYDKGLGVLLASLLILAAGCGEEGAEPGADPGAAAPGEVLPPPDDPFAETPSLDPGESIEDRLKTLGEFGRFLKALTKTEVLYELTEGGPYTVFAPTDLAFEQVPVDRLEALDADLKAYRRVLLNHIIEGQVTTEALRDRVRVRTMAGRDLPVASSPAGLTVGGGFVVLKDIRASNGLVHSIDRVLLVED